jgi:hypothetical protein
MSKVEAEIKTKMGKLTTEVDGIKEMLVHHEKNKAKFKVIVLTIFSIGIVCLAYLWCSAPKLTEQERGTMLRFPRRPKDLAVILKVIERYNIDN